MIKQVTFKFGPSREQSPLQFEPGQMTVFVGPNNSGKSLVLREISNYNMTDSGAALKVINSLQLKPFSRSEAKDLLLSLGTVDPPELGSGFHISAPLTWSRPGSGGELTIPSLDLYLSGMDAKGHFQNAGQILAFSTVQLDGHTRLSLVNRQQLGDLKAPPKNLLSHLFTNDDARNRLRELLYEAFGLYFYLDPTSIPSLQVCFHPEPPPTPSMERSLENTAVNFFKHATPIEEMSDGVKAFTGILAAALSRAYRVIVIDEPEAFLHPPLIRKLGRRLTELSQERLGNVFAATHSSDFLIGCIQANPSINVVRLTYKRGIATARHLPATQLEGMMRNPLLRSAGVLSGLFHEGVVVCEADSDRAFYQEINERLVETKEGGIDSCLFLNVNGKDQLKDVIQPLRTMGIPAAAVVDLDVIKRGTLKPLLQAAFVPDILVDNLRTLKDSLYSKYSEFDLDPKKAGIDALDKQTKVSAEAFIARLEEYGIFVVHVGEVERWLKELNVTGHTPYWLIKVFEKIGANPMSNDYVRPKHGDVWEFVRKIASWISNPHRKGIPE